MPWRVRPVAAMETLVIRAHRPKFPPSLGRVKNMAAKLAHCINDSNWETLTERRKIARICVLLKAYTGERA
jgi:hypothetical protein